MRAIYKRELKAYFTSMQVYIYLALFVCITGIFYFVSDIIYGYNDFASFVLSNFNYMIFIYAIVIPILTMRLFAEEKKYKTDQLLLTAPVSIWEIVIGKYLACVTVFVIGLALITIFPIIIAMNGTLPMGSTISGYIGVLLLALCMMAIGTLISSLTEEPVIAVIVSAAVGFLVLFFPSLVSFLPNGRVATLIFCMIIVIGIAVLFYIDTKKLWIAGIALFVGTGITTGLYFWQKEWFTYGLTTCLNWLSIEKRYEEFLNGMLNLSSMVYLLTVIGVCLFLTTQVIAKRRWR